MKTIDTHDFERVDLIISIFHQCKLEDLQKIKRMLDNRNALPKVERNKAVKINQSINDKKQ